MKKASSVSKAESQFLLVVATIVVLVGVPAVMSFLKSPDLVTEQVRKIETRVPASEESETELNVTVPVKTDSLSNTTSLIQFDCDKKDSSEEVHSTYVRLAGIPCREIEDMEVTNRSNGFSAAVIFTKGHKFTTDFIDLREGENILEITAVKADGSKVAKTLKVMRRDPASVQN